MSFWLGFLLILTVIQIGVVIFLALKILTAIEDSSEIDKSRVIYESEHVGTLTAYKGEAILELMDGSVVVMTKVEDPHE